jgi:hypothetical protein
MKRNPLILITYRGSTRSLQDWADLTGIPYGTLRARVQALDAWISWEVRGKSATHVRYDPLKAPKGSPGPFSYAVRDPGTKTVDDLFRPVRIRHKEKPKPSVYDGLSFKQVQRLKEEARKAGRTMEQLRTAMADPEVRAQVFALLNAPDPATVPRFPEI